MASQPAFLAAARGAIYGTLLNHPGALAALGEAVHAAPYLKPPVAPIMYVRPANTWSRPAAAVEIPSDADELETGAQIGILIGRDATRLHAETALDHVAGYVVVNDLCVPHASVYRPAIRQRCRDGFCVIGDEVASHAHPDSLQIEVYVNGQLRQTSSSAERVRKVAQLLVDVTEFMTLSAGDILLTGVAPDAPRVRAGDTVRVVVHGLGELQHSLVGDVA